MTDSPPPGHLADEMIAAYIDGTLSTNDRSTVTAHLADCAACRAELLAASRLAESAPGPARRRLPTAVAVAAAAAVLLIAVVQRRADAPADNAARIRSDIAADDGGALTVVTPRNGDSVSASRIAFVWNRSPTILEYSIVVQDADGRVRWSGTTADTSVLLPDSVSLVSGGILHWYVDGLRQDGRAAGTGRQQLIIR
jgi:hypothetical protein